MCPSRTLRGHLTSVCNLEPNDFAQEENKVWIALQVQGVRTDQNLLLSDPAKVVFRQRWVPILNQYLLIR